MPAEDPRITTLHARAHRSAPRSLAEFAATLAGFLLLAALVVLLPGRPFLPPDVVLVELATSLAPLYLLVSFLAALWCARRGLRLRAAAFALLLVPDAVSFARGALHAPAVDRPLGRVYVANLAERPEAVSRALATISEIDPDLVWLTEVPHVLDADRAAAFARLEADYPYGVSWDAGGGRSLHFLSRFPVRARDVFNPEGAPGRPALQLLLDVRGAPLVVYALHTHPPLQQWSLEARNETLGWVAAGLHGSRRDALVLGDLNTSAYAPGFARLVRHGRLDCVSPWTCAVGSWPAWLGPVLTPIDHVLARGEIVVVDIARAPETGSDHHPVVAELAWRPRE